MSDTKKYNSNGFIPFSGTVEELLSHMDEVDSDRVERVVVDGTEDVLLSDADSIALIKSESNVSDEEAHRILNEVKLEEINGALASLVDRGFIEVVSYDGDGMPQYGLTELGKKSVN